MKASNEKEKSLLDLFEASANALRAEIYLQQGKYSKALSDAKEAIRLDKTYAPAHAILAECYLNINEKGNIDLAIKAAKTAIEVNSNYYAPASLVLSQAYLQNKNYDLAIKSANNTLVMHSNNIIAAAIITEAHAKNGDFEGFIKEGQNAGNILTAVKKAKNLSANDRDFSKLSPIDEQQLKTRIALCAAVSDLIEYAKKLEGDYNHLVDKHNDPSSSINARNKLSKKMDLIKPKLTALITLYGTLTQASAIFLQEPTSTNKENFINALHSQDAILGKQRGYGKIGKNIALAAGTLGVGYVFAGLIHLAATWKKGKHFAFFNDTTTIKKIKGVEKQANVYSKIHALKPKQ